MKDLNQHYYNTLGLLERCSNIILLRILGKTEKKVVPPRSLVHLLVLLIFQRNQQTKMIQHLSEYHHGFQ